MSDPPSPNAGAVEPKPGKLRTWWHLLLANLLRWQLQPVYEVFEEVSVGRKPLQIDILLLRKTAGDLPESTRRMLAGLSEHLNERTLVEFKGPTDALEAGDFRTLLAYACLYCAQNEPLLASESLSLLVIAPRLTISYRDELRSCGVAEHEEEPGIWRLQGSVYPTWILETEVLVGLAHPLLTLFSPKLLRDRESTIRELRQGGYGFLVAYVVQQAQQFQYAGEEFAMQCVMSQEQKQIWRAVVKAMTPEERREFMSSEALKLLSPAERLAGIPPAERLAGIPPAERLAGIPPAERLAGLSPEELEQVRGWLQRQNKP